MIHMKIVQGNELIADIPEWDSEIPAVGDYIFHPPYGDYSPESIAGKVEVRTWRTHDRGDGEFVKTAHPYVELYLKGIAMDWTAESALTQIRSGNPYGLATEEAVGWLYDSISNSRLHAATIAEMLLDALIEEVKG